MNNYIIRIECTHKDNLSFNNNVITKKENILQNPPDLILGYISCIFPFIKSIDIVYDKVKNKKFTKKYLEFFCYNEDELNDNYFINFIDVLKRVGFNSNNKNTLITYIKIVDDQEEYKYIDILKYYYISTEKIDVDGKIKKSYNTETRMLDICKNIIV
jgi:hypothetical protein